MRNRSGNSLMYTYLIRASRVSSKRVLLLKINALKDRKREMERCSMDGHQEKDSERRRVSD